MRLDTASAHQVISELAAQLDLDVEAAAEGVLTILNANMANAIRSRTVQKGIDPRDFSLVAFGGAGPLHGAEVAAQLGIPEIIVPLYPGITSAVGLLTTDLKYDLIKTEFQVQGHIDFAKLNADLAGMEAELQKQLTSAGIQAQHMKFIRAGDLRYVGQGYELRVNLPPGEIDANSIGQVWSAFDAVHEKEYGHVFPDNSIEIVNVRLTGIGVMPKIGPPAVTGGHRLDDALVKTGRCLFRSVAASTALTRRFMPAKNCRCCNPSTDPLLFCKPIRQRWCRRHAGSPPIPTVTSLSRWRADMTTSSVNAIVTETRVDPVTASVIRGALENIAIEMGYQLMRMSYSSIIRESEDFGAAIIDANGNQLCESIQSTPLQSGPLPGYVRGIMKQMKERGDTIEPGDVILHNDPYGGASHGPDVGFVVPVFCQEQLVGFAVTAAHHLDIGALSPGSCGIVDAMDAYAEGLQFKAIKVYQRGLKIEPVWQMLRDNIRTSKLVVGDMEAQVAACRIGAQRYLELIERYGLDTVQNAYADLLDYSERLMRNAISELPDGGYTATTYLDGYLDDPDPGKKHLPLTVTLTDFRHVFSKSKITL